jgi:hypothetical protein
VLKALDAPDPNAAMVHLMATKGGGGDTLAIRMEVDRASGQP